MNKNVTTAKALEITQAFFEQYPTMPEGWRLDTSWERLQIGYVFIGGKGPSEMKAIIDALGITPEVYGENVSIWGTVNVGRTTVEVRAQMEIIEEPVKIKKSTKARVLAELTGV